MKLIILVALATAAVVSSYTPTIHSSVFKPGEEYIYHYKGQVLSGIPKSSKQYAGLFIDSIVRLQFHQDYKVLLKLENIKLFKINDKITTLPSELLPESELTRLTGDQAAIMTEHLVKPIKFRYEEGEIREIEKEVSDRFWSLNIKKGILSLLQVTLKEKGSISSESGSFYSDPLMTRIKSHNPSRGSSYSSPNFIKLVTKPNSVYRVMETDVMGNCETKYSIVSDKTHVSPSSSKMHVTAIRNFDNCVNKPFFIQGLFQGVYRYNSEKDLIQPMVHTDMIITGDRSHFLIKDVKLRGKYMFLVNGLEGGDLTTYIHQHLVLKNVESIRSPIRLVSPKPEVRGLLMVIPDEKLIPEKKGYEDILETKPYSSYQQRRRYGGSQEIFRPYEITETEDEIEKERLEGETGELVPIIDMKLTEIVECLYHESPTTREKRCSDILYEVSRILRRTSKTELKSVIIRNLRGESSSEMEYRKSEILLDILPTLPSPHAGKALLELIREKMIPELRASASIKAMSLVIKPTPSVIKSVLELFKELPKERSSTLSSKTLLRQSLLLGVGTLTHRLINIMRTHNKPVPEIITFIDSVSSELKRMLEETSGESEKVLILKSMGNMGAVETVPLLKTIVQDPRQPVIVRANAIFALRRLSKQFSKQVTPILMSVFMDVKEERELRQAAFVVIINSNPSMPTLQMIGHRIRHEPSNQLRTLVYSSLINLATFTSHEPEHKTLVKNARLIIKTIRPVPVGPHDSLSLFVNKFSEDLDLGGALNLIKIKSKDSLLPTALVANLQGTLFGKHRRLLEVGAEGKSLEVILRKVFGPHGLLKELLKGEISMRDILKPLTRPDMGIVESKIREIVQKMMYESRSETEPFGSLYIHLLGNELQYITLNSQNIEEVVNKVTNFLPELIMRLTRGVKVDVVKTLSNIATVTIPTPIGFPISLNCTTMGLLKVEGHVKVNNLPSWSEMATRFRSLSIPKLGLEVDLKPVIDVNTFVTLGVNTRWLASGVTAYASLTAHSPIKMISHIDPTQHSVSAKFYTPKHTIKTLKAEAMPLTFVKYFPLTPNKLPFHLEKKELKAEHIVKTVPFNKKVRCTISGLEVEAEGEYSLCGPTWCPTMPLYGKQQITITTRPTASVDYVHLKIKSHVSNIQYEGVPSSLRTEEMFEREPEDIEEESKIYNPRIYRPNSRSMVESGEFEPVTIDPIFQSEPIKRQILITLGPNSMHTPKVKALFTWLMSRQYWKNQLNLQVVRTGFEETPSWKVMLNNVVDPLTWYPEESFRGETEFLNKLHLLWNINGDVKEVKIKVIPGSPFDFTRELKEHSLFQITTDNLPEAKDQKYKYTVIAEFPEMSHKVLKYMTVIQDLIKYQFFSKLITSIPRTPVNNKIVVSVELLPWWEKMNVIVKTPREDSLIYNVPFYWNPFLPTTEKMTLHNEPLWNWYKNTTEIEEETSFNEPIPYKSTPIERYLGECTVNPEKLTTYDGITVRMTSIAKSWKENCEMVMTQHCSNEALFSVIGTGSEESWKLRILVPKYEIEIKNKYSKLVVVINGEERPLRESEPIILREREREEFSESSPERYIIEKPESGIIRIKALELGVTVIVNGNELTTKIKVSPMSMLQGELCGLCGNFNQDQSDDLYTETDFEPSNRDFTGFIKRHTMSSDYCNIESLNKASNEECMKESHLTITRYENETPMTCTTERKVPKCATGCRPVSTTSVKTCLTCRGEEGVTVPRKSYRPTLQRWDTFENSGIECDDFYQRIEVPTRCVPVY